MVAVRASMGTDVIGAPVGGEALIGWRLKLEAAIEAAIAALDIMDGDPDLETNSDDDVEHDGREPWEGDAVPEYADDGHDQTRLANTLPGSGLRLG